MSTIGDIASIWLGEPAWRLSGILLIIGTVTAIGAMITGLMDLRKLDQSRQVGQTVDVHMQLVLSAWVLYALSLLIRLMEQRLSAPDAVGIGLSILGLIVLMAAGWYGGKLVYEHGAGRKRRPDF
jgi:uncharacterized membrane protein